jgi:hypothetical protein
VSIAAFSADTTLEAGRVQVEVYRRMPPHQRLQVALHLSEVLREVAAAGVRSRHPNYTQEQVKLAVTRLTIGDELFCLAYPSADIEV